MVLTKDGAPFGPVSALHHMPASRKKKKKVGMLMYVSKKTLKNMEAGSHSNAGDL